MILRAVSHYNIEKDCWQGPSKTMIKVDILKEAKGKRLRAKLESTTTEYSRSQSINQSTTPLLQWLTPLSFSQGNWQINQIFNQIWIV